MKNAMRGAIVDHLGQSRDALQAAIDDRQFVATLDAIVDRVGGALAGGGKLLLAGNGGSASDAQHIAGEFLSRLNYDRAPVAAIALAADGAVMTAIGNDYGYEQLFERQVRGLGQPGDVLVGISTSGRSGNILRALDAARAGGLATIGLTGKTGGGDAGALRSPPAGSVRFDAADPAAAHHRRSHHLRPGRGAAFSARRRRMTGRKTLGENNVARRKRRNRECKGCRQDAVRGVRRV